MTLRTDCRHFRTDRPCRFHKQTGVRCGGCQDHDPIETRILIVKLDALGDVLRTTCCLQPLKQIYPRSHITWVTRANAAALLAGNPHVDRILTIESNYLELLLTIDFDLALGPDPDLLTASIMRLARAETKRGFVGDTRGGVIPLNEAAATWWHAGLDDTIKRLNRRTYGEWLYQICELPLPVARPWLQPTGPALERADRFLTDRAPGATRRACFNTGASGRWEEKRWKARSYRDLAHLIHDHEPSTALLLVGGPLEADFNAGLVASYGGFIDAGTSNSVDDFAALIAACDWVLTPDSLGYHVACAVRTPALCLVGPTSPWELDLYSVNQVLHADLECIACYLSKCPLTTTCMDLLKPGDVWAHSQRQAFATSLPGVVALQRPGQQANA